MQKPILFAHGAALSANSLWGLMSPVSKLVLLGGVISPLALSSFRMFGSMILFWIISIFVKSSKVAFIDHFKLMGASLLGIVINQTFFILGVGHTSPANASILATSMPLWAMLLSAFILKDPLTKRKILGLVIGSVGAISLILSSSTSASEQSSFVGDIFVVLAQISYASYVVLYTKFIHKYPILTIMKWMFTYAAIFVIPISYLDLIDTSFKDISALEILGILYIIVFATFLSQLCIIISQRSLSPTITGMYNYIQPVVSSIVAICLGLDSFTTFKVFAVFLVFTGVFIVTSSKKKVLIKTLDDIDNKTQDNHKSN